jgi:anti-sigma B factor antagonist
VINLYISERRSGDVTILDLKGRLRVGGNAVALHRSLRSLVLEKKLLILLDLAGVDFIDSCGLGELVASQISVEKKGGQLKLVGLSATLSELFAATRLTSVFDIFESEAEAIESFADEIAKSQKPHAVFA